MSENKEARGEVEAKALEVMADGAKVDKTEVEPEDCCHEDASEEPVQQDGPKPCCCRHKETPREDAFQQDLQKRLNRAIGQLNGVKAMLDDNRYCGDVLTQLAAAESAVHKVSEMILRNHMETCVVEQIRKGNDEVVEEALALMKRFQR